MRRFESSALAARRATAAQGHHPSEVHAYFDLTPDELGTSFELRFVMVAPSGLETPSEPFTQKPVTPRYRTRTLGLPFPPVVGNYTLVSTPGVAGRRATSGTSRAGP